MVDPPAASAATHSLQHCAQVKILGGHSGWATTRCGSECRKRKERSDARRPASGVRGTPRHDLAELQRRHRGSERCAPWLRVARLRPGVQAAALRRRVVVQLDQDNELQGGDVLQEGLGAPGQRGGSLGCTDLKKRRL